MPTLRRFANCKIAIYADDRNPPRFHIEGRGFRAIVEIETLIVRAGDPDRGRGHGVGVDESSPVAP